MIIEAVVDAAIGTSEVMSTLSHKVAVAVPTAGTPVSSDIKTGISVVTSAVSMLDAAIIGPIVGNLVSMDGAVSDINGWVVHSKKASDWILLDKPEN